MKSKTKITRLFLPHLRRFAGFYISLAFLTICLVLSPAGSFKQSAAVISLTISGNVQADGANLGGAFVTLTGSQAQTVTTDLNGNYMLTTSAGGNYTVTASKNGFVFNQASQTLTNVQSNQILNFVSGAPLCAPPSAGSVGWYRGENNVTDSSGSGNNGTFFNGTFSTGKVGQAMSFNGANNYAAIADSPSNSPTGQLTLAAWINPTTNNFQTIISKYDGSTANGISFHFFIDGGKLGLQVAQNNSITRQYTTTNAVIAAGVFQYVTATFNPATQLMEIFVNGVSLPVTLTNSGTVTAIQDSPTAVRIGNLVDNAGQSSAHFGGLIDEAQLFNRVLTVAEIKSIYNAGSAGGCASGSIVTEANSLDISFGNGGKVTTQIGSSFAFANAMEIQADNKIVAAGYSSNGANNDFALARYNPDGSLDTSFGAGGKVATGIGSSYDIATSMAMQPDGKIIAAGYSYIGTSEDFALVRYNSNGSLDNSFGTGGKVVTAFGGGNDEAYSVKIQTDGKIVAGGYSYNGSNNDFALVRYNSDGSLDGTFGTGGRVIMPFGTGLDIVRAVAIQTDGKIIAAGYFFNIGNNDFAIARYNTDGSLDTSYGTNGKVITAIGNSTDEIFTVVLQPNGKLVVSGCSNNGSNNDFALARYNTDGSLDNSFGAGGKVTTPFFNSFDIPYAVALQPDGKIVAAGFARNTSNEDFALARYNSNGSLDNSFGTGGKVTTQFENSFEIAYAAAIQSDGKIIAAGYSHIGTTENFALARYNANGATANVMPTAGLNVNFSNITQPGTTVASVLTTAQLPALPNGYSLPANVSAYDIRTSAGYTGDIAVTFDVPNIADAATCTNLRILHFENGNWTTYRYGTPIFNAGNQVCTASQTVTTLSPFAAALESPASFSFEGDVQGRPIGDGFVDADDIQQIRSFVVGGGLPYQRNEFQRADCSPRSFSGDGFIDADDIQQARRYSVGTDNAQTASGPTSGSFADPTDLFTATFNGSVEKPKFGTSEKLSKTSSLRVGSQTTGAGQTVKVPILVDAAGFEAGYTFTLSYDKAKLTDPQVEIGTAGGDVVFRTNRAGEIGISVTSFKDEKIAAGTNQVLINVTFKTAANATGAARINFTDTLARRKAAGVDPNAAILQPFYSNGQVTFTGTSADSGKISGRAVTADGRGIANVIITLTDSQGGKQTLKTTSFGYFEFRDVLLGTSVIEAAAKRFTFGQPLQVNNIGEDVTDVLLTANNF